MSLLVYAIIVMLLVLCGVLLLRAVSLDETATKLGTIVLLIVGVVVIASRAGVGL